MTTPLLSTKLYLPRIPRDIVPRHRLVERLNDGLGRKLTLISAPAGFGKTTLVSEWVSAMRSIVAIDGAPPPIAVAWLSLDENDNDPTRFISYVVAALRTVQPDIARGSLSALQSPQPPPAEAILTSLINELAALPCQTLLVLDDCHLVDAQQVHHVLDFLLTYLPPQVHLCIVTRDDPQLPLARLRARGELTELRAADLKFTSAEAAEFLSQVMGLKLSPEDIAALEARTEGWIAGLHMAAISMQGHQDPTRLIKSFSGSHRFVLDYLVEEVLDQQAESVQAFLLQTAILHRLNGSLCDVLTSQHDGRSTLEMLEHANLFIVPLDEERRWYRYHHLFADLLRQRLKRERPDLVPKLHQRASKWYEENGYIPEAVHHALKSLDFEQAAELIGRTAGAMLTRGEVTTLLRWLQALPDKEVSSRSNLLILQAWILALAGQLDEAVSCLSSVHEPYEQGEMAAIRGYIAHHQGETIQAIERCQEALELLPEERWFARGAAAVILGTVCLRRGDPVGASQAMSRAVRQGRATSQTYLTMIALSGLGEAQEMQGFLGQAVQTYKEALQLASEHASGPVPFAGMTYVGLAGPLYEMNDLDGAMDCVTKGIELSKQARNLDTLEDGYLNLALLYEALGKPEKADQAIRDLETVSQKGGHSYWMAIARALRPQWWLKRGNIVAAARCLQESGWNTGDSEAHYVHEFAEIAAAKVLIAGALSQGEPQAVEISQALGSLASLLQAAETARRMGSVIKILALQALAYHAQNDLDQAISTLERALSLAEPEGYVRTFVDEGEPMAQLLNKALARGIAPDCVQRLLAAFPDVDQEQTEPKTRPSQSELIEPLSERELEVLHLIAEGLTNREVAGRLFLSLNTVKAHTRSIYGKLDVHTRTQAVARGRNLRLLPSH